MKSAALALPVLLMLLSSCLKDGALPPDRRGDGAVDLRFDLVVGMTPFSMDQAYLDGAGNIVRFTDLKFHLSGLHLHDDDAALVADLREALLLIDGACPSVTRRLGTMADGHVHTLHFTAGTGDGPGAPPPSGTGHPPADPDMRADSSGTRLHLLMRGYVDRDGNGRFDEGVDLRFSYRPHGSGAMRERHLHLHADMIDGGPITLGLRMDVRMLFLGLDLLARPECQGADEDCQRLMNNLAAAIMVAF